MFEAKFDEVCAYTALTKSQIIEKLDLLQSEADEFERNKTGRAILVVGIVSIGYGFSPETDTDDQEIAMKNGVIKPKEASDGTNFFSQYAFVVKPPKLL